MLQKKKINKNKTIKNATEIQIRVASVTKCDQGKSLSNLSSKVVPYRMTSARKQSKSQVCSSETYLFS